MKDMTIKKQRLFTNRELKRLTAKQIQTFSNTGLKQEIDIFILSIINANKNDTSSSWRQLLQILSTNQISTIHSALIPFLQVMAYYFMHFQKNKWNC